MEKLPPEQLERMRPYLFCSDCHEKAAYVSRSTNGRAAHFRSVHLLIDGQVCPQKTLESEKVDTSGYTSVQALKNEEDVFVVDFNFTAEDTTINPRKPKDETGKDGARKRGGYRKFGEASGVGKSEWSRRLSTLLKTLKDDPDFENSHAKIKVFGFEKPINRAFYNTDRFELYQDKLTPGRFPTFFWGSIWNAKHSITGDLWLNTGESKSDLSVIIPKKVFTQISEKYGLTKGDEAAEFEAGWFLLYGWYNKSKRTGKPTLSLLENAIEFITLRLGK
ncbi:hypothetical protein [Pseudoalteromonas obscura]|uniref:hypothetical protein n=1 Tax=Pseudoalteromonas obscura TaxID=3048491 RepID=UPI0024DEF9AE|nr:hypothetical protein [Pseudoalteromonas sp. P94(2023)]